MRILITLLLGGCSAPELVEPVIGKTPTEPVADADTDADTDVDTDVDTGTGEQIVHPVDLLFSVDVGGWAYEQDRLAEAIPSLVAELEGVDWTATVITGNSSQIEARVWGSDDPAELGQAVVLGLGAASDQGMSMILATLRRHEIVRPGSTLSIVVLSAHSDESISANAFMAEALSYTDRVKLSSIVSADPLCPTAQQVGWSQIEVANLAGGVHQDSCAPSYDQGLTEHAIRTLAL